MAFATRSDRRGPVAIVTVEGELDTLAVPSFREEVDRICGGVVENLIVDMTALRYICSAGLRALVLAHQKLPDEVPMTLVGVTGEVERTIRLVGFHRSVVFCEQLPV